MYLGIDSSNKKYIDDDYSEFTEYQHYAFGDGCKNSLNVIGTECETEEYEAFHDGDLVEMELNTKQKKNKDIHQW